MRNTETQSHLEAFFQIAESTTQLETDVKVVFWTSDITTLQQLLLPFVVLLTA